MKRRRLIDPRSSVSTPSVSTTAAQTSLYCLRPEDKKRIQAKVLKLLNEGKYEEGARLIVAAVVANIDVDKFVDGLVAATRRFIVDRDDVSRTSQSQGDGTCQK